MPQVKLHISTETKNQIKTDMPHEIRNILLEKLGISEETGQVIVYETPKKNRAIHKSRDINFVLIEVTMYTGRSKDKKEELMKSLVALTHKITGIEEKDIICTIFEINYENYYGGVSHRYIEDLKNNSVKPKKGNRGEGEA